MYFSENGIGSIFIEIKCFFLVINIIYTIVLIGPFIKIVLLSLMFSCPHCCRELENFFFSNISSARLRVANAGQFPRCWRGRHRTALPRSVIARSAIFCIFYLAWGPCAGREGGNPDPAGNHRKITRLATRMWEAGPSVIGSQYFRSVTRALEGHNPRAWLNSTLIRQTHTSWSERVGKLTSYKQDTRWILRKYWLAVKFRGIYLGLLCTCDKCMWMNAPI